MCKACLEIRILCEERHRKEGEDRTKQLRSALIRKLARSGVEGALGTRLDNLDSCTTTVPSNRHVGQAEKCGVHLVLVRFNLIFVIEIEKQIEFETFGYFSGTRTHRMPTSSCSVEKATARADSEPFWSARSTPSSTRGLLLSDLSMILNPRISTLQSVSDFLFWILFYEKLTFSKFTWLALNESLQSIIDTPFDCKRKS